MRQRNPLAFGFGDSFDKIPMHGEGGKIFWLLRSVAVCNQTYAYRIQVEREPTKEIIKAEGAGAKKWSDAREKSQEEFLAAARADTSQVPDVNKWWEREIAAFRAYLNASHIITKFKFRRDDCPFLPCGPMPDAEKGRQLGCPHESTLIQFLLSSRFVQTAAEAMEYPFALAEMHHLAHLEREGCLKILNEDEIEFKETCEARDLEAAQAAGFATVEEHIEFIKGNAKKKNDEAAASKESSGLATEIPAELTTQ